jgi:hypothetical protein
MTARTSIIALFLIFLATPSLSAQRQEDWIPRPRANVGVNFIVSEPVGEFEEFVGAGFGADFFGRLPMDPEGFISLRADLGFLIYGYESKRVCFEGIGCRVQARLQTTNNIFFGGVGPELAIPMRQVRPYVHAFMGFSYFNTSSSLEDLHGFDSDFNTENFGDGTMSWGFGGGLEVNLKRGWTPIDLNLGFRYHENGRVEYLTEGDIVDNPDGSITMYPVVSDANHMSYHFGVSIGIPRGGDDRGRHR